MVSRRVLGAVAVVGLGAGVVLAGAQHTTGANRSAVAEVNRLYHDEVSLSAREANLQAALASARAAGSRTASNTPIAVPAAQAAAVMAPASPGGRTTTVPGAAPAAAAPAVAAPTPSDTESDPAPNGWSDGSPQPAAPAASTTSTTAPPPATTTTVAPTTTTTRPPRSDD